MTQPAAHSQPAAPQAGGAFSPMPVFPGLQDYIQAAACGSRASLYHLVCAIFTLTRTLVLGLADHFKAHPRALTPAIIARFKYCAARLHAILYTLQHAPERFLAPAQLRALTRARAILAHVTRQPVDFSPLAPVVAPAAACAPALPRSSAPAPPSRPVPVAVASSGAAVIPSTEAQPSSAPAASPSALRTPSSALPAANPLLLRSPGCALATVLLHIAAIYRVPASPALSPLPQASPSDSPAPSGAASGEPARSALGAAILKPVEAAPGAFAPSSDHPQSAISTPHAPSHRAPP